MASKRIKITGYLTVSDAELVDGEVVISSATLAELKLADFGDLEVEVVA